MAWLHLPPPNWSAISEEFWRGSAAGGWPTALFVLLLLVAWKPISSFSGFLLRRRRRRRTMSPLGPRIHTSSPLGNPLLEVSKIITDADLRDLIKSLEGRVDGGERWEDVVEKKNDQVSYSAKCCRPKDGPLKYLSITIFEKCSTELLRDFYMDNEYRKKWDKTVIEHKQLLVDETSGTEIGQTIKKFPLMTPREYILAWRVWEGKDKTFYCLIKDCEHPLAPRQRKYVRVQHFKSGWCIRKVPGKDVCEVKLLHQEDAGMNVEIAKMAFAKGIWTYVCKMNSALREYSTHNRDLSPSVATLLKLIQKVPPELEIETETTNHDLSESSAVSSLGRQPITAATSERLSRKPSKKLINGLLLFGGIVCLSRGRTTLGTQLAMACILKKLMKHKPASSQTLPSPPLLRRRRA